MSKVFNAHEYWESRHYELQDDYRNVGNRGLTSEQNLILIASKVALVTHRLGAFGLTAGASLLDAGCGAGVFTSMLSPLGFELHGCDVSPTAIETAKKTKCGEFVVSSLAEVGFAKQFDVVCCLDVMFHVVDDAEWNASVNALLGAVKPGGYFIIIEQFTKGGGQARHCRWRSVEEYQQALSGGEWVEISTFEYPHERAEKTLLIMRRDI